jgi:LCP family protein required for cell wall assembly
VLSWVAVVTSVAVLAAARTGYVLLQRYDGNINRIAGVLGNDGDQDLPADDGPRTVLIVGSDSRDVEGQNFQGVGDEEVTGQRSDVIILAHLYGGSDAVQLVSIPRDSWVTIPAHIDPESGEQVPADESKINTAFFAGGPALLVDTVEQLSGLDIDHYMQVDFDGFRTIIDELDGVDVCLSEAVRERKSGIDLPAGVSTVRGEQALAFVRQREGLARSDIDRIERQQRLLGALVNKTLSRGTLANPLRLNGVLESATSALTVDDGLSFGELRNLALRLREFSSGGVLFTTIPVSDINGRREGQSVVLIDEVGAEQLFAAIRRDEAPGSQPPPDGPPQEPLIVAPDRIELAVVNGSSTSGLGARAADDLAALGFLVGTPDSREGAATGTVVRHGPDRADSARTVAAAVPGATTVLVPDLDGVELVVGSSYDGAQPVTVTGSVEDPAPGVEQPPITAAADPCGI